MTVAGGMRFVASLCVLGVGACASHPTKPTEAETTGPADAAFDALADRFLDAWLARHPSLATDLGVHTWDAQLEDPSRAARAAELAELHQYASEFAAVAPVSLSPRDVADRELVLGAIDSMLLSGETLDHATQDPDGWASSLAASAFSLAKRPFAATEVRFAALIARLEKMPGYLAAGRALLGRPPRVATEIAIDQIDGNIDFFKTVLPAAFKDGVPASSPLWARFEAANKAVLEALAGYKTFLVDELLPRSDGNFALGAANYARKLRDEEGIDTPLERLVAIGMTDLRKNQADFAKTAAELDPTHPAREVFARLAGEHPAPGALLQVTQATLDELRRFLAEHHIVHLPDSADVRVAETPSFMRALTSASMDTPGPFETAPLQAFYFMTLPDPTWSAADTEDFMRQWYLPMISNVTVHEVYPGHFVQFLHAHDFPSRLRKVFGSNANAEGWAHYGEQMVLDEGWKADDKRYRLAQLQDALLRDARLVCGIRMHTQGMSVEEAQRFFVDEAYQPQTVARAEARRGTSDPTYGYYTLGKLMILALREAVRAKEGAAFSLAAFHDALVSEGPLPLPALARKLLGHEVRLLE